MRIYERILRSSHTSDQSSIPTTVHDLHLLGRADIPLIFMICMICMISMIQLTLPGGSRIISMIQGVFPGLELCYRGPAQHLVTAGQDTSDLRQIVVYMMQIQQIVIYLMQIVIDLIQIVIYLIQIVICLIQIVIYLIQIVIYLIQIVIYLMQIVICVI